MENKFGPFISLTASQEMNVPVSQVFGSGKLACRGVAIGISHSGEIIWSMEMSMAMLETAVEGVKCKAISFYRKGKLTPK